MKVYSLPKEVPAPTIDFTGKIDWEKLDNDEREHQIKLKEWLVSKGYTGKLTGETISFGVADGQAQYMIAEGSKTILIHLPYGDAYQYPDVKFLPKKEIVRRINTEKELTKLFSNKQ